MSLCVRVVNGLFSQLPLLSCVYESRFAHFCEGLFPQQDLNVLLLRVPLVGAGQIGPANNAPTIPVCVSGRCRALLVHGGVVVRRSPPDFGDAVPVLRSLSVSS